MASYTDKRTRKSRVRTERTPVSITDFEAELVKLETNTESKNFLFYGDSNAGKTHLTATAPGRVCYLVCEPGYKTAARVRERLGLLQRGDCARVIGDSATALAAVDWLNAGDRYKRYDWVHIDGATTMQDRIRLAYCQEAFDHRPESRAHRNVPDRPDYFNTQNFIRSWVPLLVDMPVNLTITAYAWRTDKTENGELLVFPGFQGKVTEMANAVAGLMDVVGYYQLRKVRNKRTGRISLRRRLWFETPSDDHDVRYICGDKFGVLGPYMDNPTMTDILAQIDGNPQTEGEDE